MTPQNGLGAAEDDLYDENGYVTDPDLIAELNAPETEKEDDQYVTDPDLLAELNAPEAESKDVQYDERVYVNDPDLLAELNAPEVVEPSVEKPVAAAPELAPVADFAAEADKLEVDKGRLRNETYQMLKDANLIDPYTERNVADESQSLGGGFVSTAKLLGAGVMEVLSDPLNLEGWKGEPKLDVLFTRGGDDLKSYRDSLSQPYQAKERDLVQGFISYFEGNNVSDGRAMINVLKDSIRENAWDSSSDDKTRVLADGTLRVNPSFVALPSPQEGLDAIDAAPVTNEAKEQEKQLFLAARTYAANALDQKSRQYDEDYRAYAELQEASGVTDPEKIFYNWPGLDRNWIENSWDVVRDVVAQSGRNILNTAVRAPAMGLAEMMGDTEDVERIGRDSLASQAKSQFTSEIAAARGQEGMVVGTGKALATSVLDMVPMFTGAKAGRLIAGPAEAHVARRILGNMAAKGSVYGYAGMQGYASLMQTALQSAEAEAKKKGRELTGEEINKTVEKFQGAALANGLKTIILSKLMPEGSEKAALQGLTAQTGRMTGRDVLNAFKTKYGADGWKAAIMSMRPEIIEFSKQAYKAGKVGFKDESIEESADAYLEGLISKISGADPDLTYEEMGTNVFQSYWMGGTIGAGLPVAMRTLGERDSADLAARKLATQSPLPPATQAAVSQTFDQFPTDGPAVEEDQTGPEWITPRRLEDAARRRLSELKRTESGSDEVTTPFGVLPAEVGRILTVSERAELKTLKEALEGDEADVGKLATMYGKKLKTPTVVTAPSASATQAAVATTTNQIPASGPTASPTNMLPEGQGPTFTPEDGGTAAPTATQPIAPGGTAGVAGAEQRKTSAPAPAPVDVQETPVGEQQAGLPVADARQTPTPAAETALIPADAEVTYEAENGDRIPAKVVGVNPDGTYNVDGLSLIHI